MSNYKQQMINNQIAPWYRTTVADGRALNKTTIQKFNSNDQLLGEGIDDLNTALDNEINTRTESDNVLHNEIEEVQENLNNEIEDRTNADNELSAKIDYEVERATTAEQEIRNEISEKLSNVYKFKGTIETSGIKSTYDRAQNGEVYNLKGPTVIIESKYSYDGTEFSACQGDNIVFISGDDEGNKGWDILAGTMKFYEIDEYDDINKTASGLTEGKAIYPIKEWQEDFNTNSAENLSNNYDLVQGNYKSWGNLSGFKYKNYSDESFSDEINNDILSLSGSENVFLGYDKNNKALTVSSYNYLQYEYNLKDKSYGAITDYEINNLKINQLAGTNQTQIGYYLNISAKDYNGTIPTFLLFENPSIWSSSEPSYKIPVVSAEQGYQHFSVEWKTIGDLVEIPTNAVLNGNDEPESNPIILKEADTMPTTWEENTYYII